MKLKQLRPLLAFASLTLVSLLTSCNSIEERDALTLQVWHGFNSDETKLFNEEIVPAFEEYYEAKTGKDITLDIQFVAFDSMETKLRTAALGGMTPDVAFMDAAKVPSLSYGKAILKINELPAFIKKYGDIETANKEYLNQSFQSVIVNVQGEEDLYGIPVQTTTVALYYNRDMFRDKTAELRAAGIDPNRPPRDWDEVISYGKILTDQDRGVYGFALDGGFWFNLPFFNMYDAEFISFDESTGIASSAIDSENARVAFTRLQTLANSGIESGSWAGGSSLGPSQMFVNSKCAMILTGPWEITNFEGAGINFDISLVPGPTAEEVELLGLKPKGDTSTLGQLAYTSSNLGGQTGVILRSSKNTELAFEFIEYFTSKETQQIWASRLGQIPVRLSAWEDLDTSQYPFMTKFMDQLEYVKPVPQIPQFGKMDSNIFKPEFELLLKEQQDPEATVKRIKNGMDNNVLKFYNDALE